MNHSINIYPGFRRIYQVLLVVTQNHSVVMSPQTNTARRLFVQKGTGTILMNGRPIDSVSIGETVDVPERATLEIYSNSGQTPFHILITQNTPMSEDMFVEQK